MSGAPTQTPAAPDRLTGVDASFLHQEGPSSHMHIGAVLVLDGPAPGYEDFCDHVLQRIRLERRYRQKLAPPRLAGGRPRWTDDRRFALDYHVRHTALPAPAGEAELRRLAGRLFSQPLDRSKPLWELWLVDALDGDRFALIVKLHHAMVDGLSGIQLALVLFDAQPGGSAPPPGEPEAPRPARHGAGISALRAGERARGPWRVRFAAAAARRRAVARSQVRDVLEGLREVARALHAPAPKTPLNVETGAHRRVAFSRYERIDFNVVRKRSGGTVNDVALAVVTGALRRWLESRAIPTGGLALQALVPVSVRRRGERARLGNRLAVMRASLPVGVDDPVARLGLVRQTMDELKSSPQARGTEMIASVQSVAPAPLLTQLSRLQFSTRLFNLLVTHIPGPGVPMYLLGREVLELLPVAFLPRRHALSIGIASYNGRLTFGLLGDRDAIPDLDTIAAYLDASLAELLDAVAERPG